MRKMKVRVLFLFLTVFTFLAFFPFSEAKAKDAYSASLPRLVDSADVLTDEEEEKLLTKLNYLSEKYEFDIVIKTMRDAEYSSIKQYADNFYDINGYGFDHGGKFDNTGLALVMDFGKRDWAISTIGRAYREIKDTTIDEMADGFLPFLSNGDIYKGFDTFADLMEQLIVAMQAGTQVNFAYAEDLPEASHTIEDGESQSPFVRYGIPIFIGLIAAIAIVAYLSSQLNNVVSVSHAGQYEVEGSFVLTEQADHFLYRTVTKQKIQKSSSSSSSGGSHGGSSGKF